MMKPTKPNWPITPSSVVFHGPIGAYVQDVAPDSEADPYAVLAQALIMFGNRVGRSAYLQVGADRHFANDFLMLIGTTGSGRKGTSLGVAKALFKGPEIDYLTVDPKHGLSSSEGLIWAVRDEAGEDEGVKDKRLMVIEAEFASVLRQTERHGNTLSALVRQCWESGNLSSMTKNSPTKATGAHVSIIGHMTPSEMDRYFSRTEMANGFGNRFLWFVCRRSKMLSEPREITMTRCRRHRDELADALDAASQIREVKRTGDAQELWNQQYPFLEEERDGLAGELLARGTAHVNRLSLIYALADGKSIIGIEHLRAALELWRYSQRCVEHLFPTSTGNPLADKVLNLIRERPGISRTDLIRALSNHSSGLSHALAELTDMGLIEVSSLGGKGTGSKSCETYFPVQSG